MQPMVYDLRTELIMNVVAIVWLVWTWWKYGR